MEGSKDLKYTRNHEWVQKQGDTVKIGISDYAQHALGDLVFINLPEVGSAVNTGQAFADVESVKAVSDVYSPVTGIVSAVNAALLDAPESVNEAPYDAWFIEVKDVSETGELMDADHYAVFVENEQS